MSDKDPHGDETPQPDPGGRPGAEPGNVWPTDFLRPREEDSGPANSDQEQVTEPVQPAAEDSAGTFTDTDALPAVVDWEGRYHRERKRSRVFMATTAAAALLFTGTLAYAVAATGPDEGTAVAVPGAPGDGDSGTGGWGGRGGGPAGTGPRGGHPHGGDWTQPGDGSRGWGRPGDAGAPAAGDGFEDYEEYDDYEDYEDGADGGDVGGVAGGDA